MDPLDRARRLSTVEQIATLMSNVSDSMVREAAAYTCIWGRIDPDGNRDVIDLRISLLRELIDRGEHTGLSGPVARTPRYERLC
jgi:hypothetical protein